MHRRRARTALQEGTVAPVARDRVFPRRRPRATFRLGSQALLLSRGGFSWFGGFAGGVAAGLVLLRRHRISIVPVHPTQLYETLALLPVAWMLLRWRRDRRSDSFVLAAHLASAGLVRFGIEFLRAQQPLVGPLALAHLFAFVAICVGLALIWRSWSIAIADGRDDSEA